MRDAHFLRASYRRSFFAVIIIVFESLLGNEGAFHDKLWYDRIILSLQAGIELAVTQGCSLPVKSRVALWAKSLFSIGALFLLAIFCALVTSKLTADQLVSQTVYLSEARGKRIGGNSDVLEAFMQRPEIGAHWVEYKDLLDATRSMVGGSNPEGLVGPASSDTTVQEMY